MPREGTASSWELSDTGSVSSESRFDVEIEDSLSTRTEQAEESDTYGFCNGCEVLEGEYDEDDEMSVCSPDNEREEVSVQGVWTDEVLQEASSDAGSCIEGPFNTPKHRCEYPSQWIRNDGCISKTHSTKAKKHLAYHRGVYMLQSTDSWYYSDEYRNMVRPPKPGTPWIDQDEAIRTYCRFS